MSLCVEYFAPCSGYSRFRVGFRPLNRSAVRDLCVCRFLGLFSFIGAFCEFLFFCFFFAVFLGGFIRFYLDLDSVVCLLRCGVCVLLLGVCDRGSFN